MKTLISIGLIFSSLAVYSQNKFSSIQVGEKYTRSQIKSAVNNANWCGYYHQEVGFKLQFDDGAIVYLKSKNQLLLTDNSYLDNCFQSELLESNNIHVIAENGNIFVPKSHKFFKSKN